MASHSISESGGNRVYQHLVKFDERSKSYKKEPEIGACVTAFRNPDDIMRSLPIFAKKHPEHRQIVQIILGRFPDWEKLLDRNADLGDREKRRKAELLRIILNINRKRNKLLEEEIRNFRFGFNKIEGHWIESGSGGVIEETFLIFAPADQKETLIKLLVAANKAYDQDGSLLIVDGTAYLVKHNADDIPEKLGEFHYQPNELGALYSRVKGRAFRFGAVKESCGIRWHYSNSFDVMAHTVFLRLLNERGEDYAIREIERHPPLGITW